MERDLLRKFIIEHGDNLSEFVTHNPDDYTDNGPEEEDLAIDYKNNLSVVGGRHLGKFKSQDEAEEAAKKYMHQHNYYPNCWYIDDHGGAEIISKDWHR